MTARRGYSKHHHRTLDYQARLQARLERQPEDAEYVNLLRSARLHQLLHGDFGSEATGAKPSEGLTGSVASRPRGTTDASHNRGPLFDLAADLARQEAMAAGLIEIGFSVKVPAHPLGDRLTLVRDSGAA